VDVTTNQPGWNEARKLAGQAYARVSYPLVDPLESQFSGQAALLNKTNTVRVLDNVIASLRAMRQALADENEVELAARIHGAMDARGTWQVQRQKSDWNMSMSSQPLPTSADIMGRLFLFGKGRKPKDKK